MLLTERLIEKLIKTSKMHRKHYLKNSTKLIVIIELSDGFIMCLKPQGTTGE